MKMLRSRVLLAAMLCFQIFQSGVSTTTVAVTSSWSSNSSLTSLPSSVMASQSSRNISATPSGTSYVPVTSAATPGTATATAGGESPGGSTVLPTKSVSPSSSVNQTAPTSVRYITWSAWSAASDCQKTCCDTGGAVIREIRNCTIIKKRCQGLDKCSDYGVIERYTPCTITCADCMPNTGNVADAAVMTMFVNIFLTILMAGP